MQGKRKRKKKIENSLLTAMRFVSIAQRSTGAPEQTHCRLFNQFASGSNGIISVGHAIQEDIQVCPHTATLTDALENLPDSSFALTLLENNRLAIRAEQFEAIVHCVSNSELPVVGPDAANYLCDNRFTNALDIAGVLATEGAAKVINASIQIRNQSVLSSNGNVIIEAWHGISMPELLIAPKALCTAAKKAQDKTLYRFGLSPSSLTAWYSDGSWLKSQLYPSETELPNLLQFLNIPATPVPIDDGFFEMLKRLEPFSEDGQILFTNDGARVVKQSMSTFATEAKRYVPAGLSFSIKSLLTVQPFAKKVHFNAAPGISLFYGDTVRAAVATKAGV